MGDGKGSPDAGQVEGKQRGERFRTELHRTVLRDKPEAAAAPQSRRGETFLRLLQSLPALDPHQVSPPSLPSRTDKTVPKASKPAAPAPPRMPTRPDRLEKTEKTLAPPPRAPRSPAGVQAHTPSRAAAPPPPARKPEPPRPLPPPARPEPAPPAPEPALSPGPATESAEKFAEIEKGLQSIFQESAQEPEAAIPPPPPPPPPPAALPVERPSAAAVEAPQAQAGTAGATEAPSPGPGKEVFQKVESDLADIFHEGDGGSGPEPVPAPAPSPVPIRQEALDTVEEAPAAPPPGPTPGGSAGLSDFVSRVMEEFDQKVSDRPELAETSEMTTEELERQAKRSLSDFPDPEKKPSKSLPRKDLDALKNLFSDKD